LRAKAMLQCPLIKPHFGNDYLFASRLLSAGPSTYILRDSRAIIPSIESLTLLNTIVQTKDYIAQHRKPDFWCLGMEF
jgi:hypothetical protein